ncbi:DUF4083 family protein [Falsibacillus albus]|uniref:DUF4083 domain-containing protein n=1 Tax=Falsibacillus albus TaxID=2478915 RepID=A0A3L7JTS4_9BACI|nr:DUF4083 family protein [Falsibacillus albus]RLQ93664.1 DUF4083 domain-containing protein [Falsibacillus albus]
MGAYNGGDLLFQFFSFGLIILLIVLTVFLFRSYSQRWKKLDKIEKKLDTIMEQVKKMND